MGVSLALTVNAKHPPLHVRKISSNIFPLSVKLEQRNRNYMTFFMLGVMSLCISASPEPHMYVSFPKNRARSSSLSHVGKTLEGISDLPSAPEMDGKGMMGWLLAPCEAHWR